MLRRLMRVCPVVALGGCLLACGAGRGTSPPSARTAAADSLLTQARRDQAPTPSTAVFTAAFSYVALPPDFAGRVAHTTYRSDDTGPDGTQTTLVDAWLCFTAVGQLDLMHTSATTAAGQPLGEQLLAADGGKQRRAVGSDAPSNGGTAACESLLNPAGPDGLAGYLTTVLPFFPFVNAARLAAAPGLTQQAVRAPSQPPPTLVRPPGTAPVITFLSPDLVTPWESSGHLTTGDAFRTVIEIGSDGHEIYRDGRVANAHGTVKEEQSIAYGAVDVYAAAPATAFAFSAQACTP